MAIVRIRVLFFGVVRDITGVREDTVDVASGSALATVFEHYASKFPRLREMSSSLVLARNQQFSDLSTLLGEGDEVAFLPPVSGGSTDFLEEIADPNGNFFAITRHPIDARALASRLQRPEDGAVVTFDGVTRNNTKGRATRHLEYECYQKMAIQVMAELGRDIASRPTEAGAIGRIGIIHRVGHLEIKEASVVIVVTSPNRRAAFLACHDAIDRLKRTVPIWKKEFFEDGEVWVEGEWDASLEKAHS